MQKIVDDPFVRLYSLNFPDSYKELDVIINFFNDVKATHLKQLVLLIDEAGAEHYYS